MIWKLEHLSTKSSIVKRNDSFLKLSTLLALESHISSLLLSGHGTWKFLLEGSKDLGSTSHVFVE